MTVTGSSSTLEYLAQPSASLPVYRSKVMVWPRSGLPPWLSAKYQRVCLASFV